MAERWIQRRALSERLRGWAAAVALAAVLFLALAGLHPVLQGWGWWWWCALLTVVSVGSGVVARALGWGRVWSPLLGLVVTSALVVWRFASDTAWLGVVPTAESFGAFAGLVRDSTYSIAWQTVPARADDGILFVISLGVLVVLLLAEVAAFSLRMPALVGVLLAALFLVPTVPPEGGWSPWLFVLTGVGFLVLLLVDARGARERRGPAAARRRMGRVVPAVTLVSAGAVVAGLVVPAALPSTDVAVTSSGLGPSVATGSNPILRLGEDLRRNEALPVLSYSTVTGVPLYLRLSVITDLRAATWQPDPPALEWANRPADVARAPGLDRAVLTSREVVFVHVGNLRSPWLPVPYPSTRVTGLAGEWRWEADSLTFASGSALAAGEDFAVESVRLEPTPAQLLAAGSAVPPGMERYLALPEVAPIVAESAREFTEGASSPYEKAVALQQALRSSRFHYSEQAPVSGGYDASNVGAVAGFLEQGGGYCIHFASAMAVMARMLGIPSRVVVGFQPGTRVHGSDAGRTLFEVSTHDLHAWPELFFDGVGWVAFEPTPSRGALPAYANPAVEGVPEVTLVPSGPIGPVDAGDPPLPEIVDGPTVAGWLTTVDYRAWLGLGAIVLLAAGLMFAPAAVRSVVRSRRLARVRSGRGSPALAWREVLDTALDAGVDVARGATPRAVVARLSRARGMTEDARAALERLCAALELAEFGPPGRAVLAGDPALADDVELVVARLLSGLEGGDLARARLFAPSVVVALDRLRKEGRYTAAVRERASLPDPVSSKGTVSDLVTNQRR